MSQVSDVGQTRPSPNIKSIMLKIRNYYTAIVKALEHVPHVSYLVRSTLTSTLRRSSTLNPFGSASSCARPSGLESGDPS